MKFQKIERTVHSQHLVNILQNVGSSESYINSESPLQAEPTKPLSCIGSMVKLKVFEM
jgi:hypothetical protein